MAGKAVRMKDQAMTPEDPETAAMPPPASDAMPGEQSAVPDQEQDGDIASPEEQKLYDQFVAQAFKMIYSKDKGFDTIVKALAGGNDPKAGLANVTAMIVSRVYQSAKGNGVNMPADVVWAAGKEIFEDLANISAKAGIKDFSKDEDAFEGAYFLAADKTRMALQQAGAIDKGAAAADMQKLQEMDKSGELRSMFESLAAKDGEASQGGKEPAEDEEAMPPPTKAPSRGLAMGMN